MQARDDAIFLQLACAQFILHDQWRHQRQSPRVAGQQSQHGHVVDLGHDGYTKVQFLAQQIERRADLAHASGQQQGLPTQIVRKAKRPPRFPRRADDANGLAGDAAAAPGSCGIAADRTVGEHKIQLVDAQPLEQFVQAPGLQHELDIVVRQNRAQEILLEVARQSGHAANAQDLCLWADCAANPEAVPGPYVFLGASDDGCGMDQETLAQAFEPFFTTKEVGKGTGLGLSVVHGIVLQHGGFVTVSSEPGVGTMFTIYFPRHPETTVEVAVVPPAAVAIPDARGETVLVVEDEPALLKMTTRLLERRGYTVVAAPSTGEALRLAREHAGEIHLLLTDVLMPEMNGRDLARQFVALRPTIRVLFMSGYPDDTIGEKGVLVGASGFLPKPFSAHGLAVAVRQVLDRNQPRL